MAMELFRPAVIIFLTLMNFQCLPILPNQIITIHAILTNNNNNGSRTIIVMTIMKEGRFW